MITENKRKLALFLMLTLLINCVYFMQGTTTSKAATKKAALGNVQSVYYYEDGNRSYIKVPIKNMKNDAKYTVSISNEKVAEFINFTLDEFHFRAKKTGTVSITVKETYKKKVRKVGTKTITVRPGSEDPENQEDDDYDRIGVSIYYPMLIMEEGMNIPMEEVIRCYGDVEVDYGDTSIVSLEDEQLIQAHKVGTTEWTFTYEKKEKDEDGEEVLNKYVKTINFKVTEQDEGTKMQENRELAEQITQLCNTTITSKNADTLLKKIYAVYKKMGGDYIEHAGTCQGEYDEATGEYDEASIGQVMIPAKYSTRELSAVKKKCENASSVDWGERGISLEVVKIKKATPKKIVFQLSHAVTNMEAVALNGEDYLFALHANGIKYYSWKKIKKGDKVITVNIGSGDKLKAGQTYYAKVSNKKNKTVKTIKIKCTKK